jgi:hypothetical protein
MALIDQEGKYIKLSQKGEFEIYTSEEARIKVKNSIPGEAILNKYLELIKNLELQEERRYYDPDWHKEYIALCTEYQDYRYDLNNCITGKEYPIMASFYPDITNSIPDIICKGIINMSVCSVEEAYTDAKQSKYWGETVDA